MFRQQKYNIILSLVGCLAGSFFFFFFLKLLKLKLARGVGLWDYGDIPFLYDPKQGGGRGVSAGREASEGSHSGMF